MVECRRCGTCCVAPDISSLKKGAGERCPHLGESLECQIYPRRPSVCRGYRPDEICGSIAAPTLEERVERYLELFELRRSGAGGAGIPPEVAMRERGRQHP